MSTDITLKTDLKIKKTMIPVIAMLEGAAEAGSTVADILDEAYALASPKGRASSGVARMHTFIKNAAGDTIAIFDYYFKRWMPLVGDEAVEFGAKAGSSTGYSTMCKEGTSHWTKQQREAKKALGELLGKVEAGELDPSDIADEKAKIEEAKKVIADTDLGFDSLDELVAYLEAEGEEFEVPEVPSED